MRPPMASALVVTAGLASLANAQSVEVLVNDSSFIKWLSGSSGALPVLTASVYLDLEGASDTPWSDFAAWASLIGSVTVQHETLFGTRPSTSEFLIPSESPGETAGNPNFGAGDQPDTWTTGRRPDAIGTGGGSFGGWRFPTLTSGYAVTDHGDGLFTLDDGGAPINMGQLPAALGNAFPNTSERIEIFRFEIQLTTPGFYTFGVDVADLAYFHDGFNSNTAGLQNQVTVNTAFVQLDVPSPTSIAPLALGALAFRRRR